MRCLLYVRKVLATAVLSLRFVIILFFMIKSRNLYQWFPNFFVCRRRKSLEQNSRHTNHFNLFQLMLSGIADNSENGGDLFLGEDRYLCGQPFPEIE